MSVTEVRNGPQCRSRSVSNCSNRSCASAAAKVAGPFKQKDSLGNPTLLVAAPGAWVVTSTERPLKDGTGLLVGLR